MQCEEQREFWKLENKIPTQEQLVAALRMNTVREKKGGKSGYVGHKAKCQFSKQCISPLKIVNMSIFCGGYFDS